MNNEENLESRLQRFFRSKARELKAQSDQAIVPHAGLQGSHREDIHKGYLQIILPERFKVGNGMIYDSYDNRSKEADIVLWDANNYPSIPQYGHSLFFAESVRAVLEVKTTWKAENLADIKEKCRKITNLRVVPEPTVIDEVAYMKEVIKSILTRNPVPMYTLEAPRIGMAVIVFNGGENFSAQDITQEEIGEMDSAWPDILLLLSAGKVIRKSARNLHAQPKNIRQYEGKVTSFTGAKWLEFLNVKEDALLVFTSALLELLRNRTIQTEAPFYLESYISQILRKTPLDIEWVIEFPVLPSSYPGRRWFPN